MNALEVLHNRVSTPVLVAPAPSGEVLQNIQKAALRAADHRMLRPWRFLVLEGGALNALGKLMVEARLAEGEELSEELQQRIAAKPHRAPMIIVAIACIEESPKVPEWEQLVSTGCTVQNMLNAAFAQGVGAMWRTGSLVDSNVIKSGLGLEANEKIVGFLYLGQPKAPFKEAPKLAVEEYFKPWAGQ